jgi:hypothetical protein
MRVYCQISNSVITLYPTIRMPAAAGEDAAAAKVDRLRHFVAADLTRL